MKIPKTLKIGGHIIDVEFTDNEVHINNRMGNSSSSENVIQVSSRYPKSQQASVLLHEIIHTVLDYNGYKYGNEDQGVHCEKVVESLAQSLYQVLKDNKLKFD